MIICINRHNVKGGANNIYTNDKTLFCTTLLNSEAIIINDNKLLHDVSWLSEIIREMRYEIYLYCINLLITLILNT